MGDLIFLIVIGLIIVIAVSFHLSRNILIKNTPDKKPEVLPIKNNLPDVGENMCCSFLINVFPTIYVQDDYMIFQRGSSPIVTYIPDKAGIQITTLVNKNRKHKFLIKNVIFSDQLSRFIISYTKRDVDIYLDGKLNQSYRLPNIPILHSGPIRFDDKQPNLIIQYFEYCNYSFNLLTAYLTNQFFIGKRAPFPKKSTIDDKKQNRVYVCS